MQKAKAVGHITTGSTAASEVPVVSFDYAFVGDRESPITPGQDEANQDEYEENDANAKRITNVLVGNRKCARQHHCHRKVKIKTNGQLEKG